MKRVKQLREAAAFTLVEVMMSVIVVGVMFVAALNTVGSARIGEYKIAERNRGLFLAQDLMAEILQQAYDDPDDPVAFGTESGEGTSNRADFDDVDDYHGWSKSAPERRDGSAIPDLDGWGRSVAVVWVNPADLSQTVGSDQGAKRMTVTVTHNGLPVASMFALRTSAWPGLADE
jgi:MSHA pilin protein MshD